MVKKKSTYWQKKYGDVTVEVFKYVSWRYRVKIPAFAWSGSFKIPERHATIEARFSYAERELAKQLTRAAQQIQKTGGSNASN